MRHFKVEREGTHLGYVNKDFYKAITDLEPIHGDKVYKVLGLFGNHIYGSGIKINKIDISNEEISLADMFEIMSDLFNKDPKVIEKREKKPKSNDWVPVKLISISD